MIRYIYFRIRFHQWFKNLSGIKSFAQQSLNWILRSTFKLASRLKKINRNCQEQINAFTLELEKREKFPVIDADDFAIVQKEIRNYSLIEKCVIVAEAFFNFFAARALFNFEGWLAIFAQVIFAIGITWVSIPLFRNLFAELIKEVPYKGITSEPRNWNKLLILLIPLAVVYELGMFSLCKLRGEQIEGGQPGLITTLMIIIGMLLPVLAGYFAFERRKFYSPYINTLQIENLQHKIGRLQNIIQVNQQKMETHFKQEAAKAWALLQEFNTYKENYNVKKDLPQENLTGHFSENQQKFIEEAIQRYQKEALGNATLPEIFQPRQNWPQLQAAQFNSLNL
jgi:hypothetical protein